MIQKQSTRCQLKQASTIFSRIYERNGKLETGRCYFNSSGSRPAFFNSSLTFACLKAKDTIALLNDVLKRSARKRTIHTIRPPHRETLFITFGDSKEMRFLLFAVCIVCKMFSCSGVLWTQKLRSPMFSL